MTTEIDRRPQLTVVEPATGARREQLITECKFVTQQDMNGFWGSRQSFARFVEIIVELMGGERNDKNPKMTISTPFMIDKKGGRAIRFTAGQNIGPEVTLRIAPEWFALPDKERQEAESRLTEPFLMEAVNTQYYYPSIPFLEMYAWLSYPRQATFLPYATENPIIVKETRANGPLERRIFLFNEQKVLAGKIFNAWQSSQPQTPPAPQA